VAGGHIERAPRLVKAWALILFDQTRFLLHPTPIGYHTVPFLSNRPEVTAASPKLQTRTWQFSQLVWMRETRNWWALHLANGADGQAGGAATVGCAGKRILPALTIDGSDGAVLDTEPALLTQVFSYRAATRQGTVGDYGRNIAARAEFGREDAAVQAQGSHARQIHRRHTVEGCCSETPVLLARRKVQSCPALVAQVLGDAVAH
jgi:hypothetical protein